MSVSRVALCVALATGIAACSTSVQHGLDESAANEVVSALERAGIGAEKIADEGGREAGFTIRVPDAVAARALEVLRASGLPRARRHGFAEVYGQPSLIPTASEERARYLEALGGEVERTLETVDGVVSARVHIVLAEIDPLATDGKPRTPARAAVLIKARPGKPPLSDGDVQKLVAGSVPGLDAAAVAVVVTAAPEGGPEAALAAVGPLRVSAATRPVLIGALVVGLVIVGALAVMLLVAARRPSSAQRRTDEAGGATPL